MGGDPGATPAGTQGEPTESVVPGADAPDDLEETVIEARSGWGWVDFRELWRSRELLFFLAWRDVKVRYKQTLLGAAWAILQPTLMMVVFTIVLGRMAGLDSGGIEYPLFVYAGLLPWTFFATAITNAGNSVVDSERLITKVYFPRLNIPFAAVGAALVDFAIAFGVLLVLMLWYGRTPAWTIVLVPVLIVLLTLAALGIGALLAALNVAYRDVRYVLPFMIQLWMFATPSIYMQTTGGVAGGPVGGTIGGILDLNPMVGLIAAFRAAFLGTPIPWSQLGLSAALILALFVIGCFVFRRVEDSFADII